MAHKHRNRRRHGLKPITAEIDHWIVSPYRKRLDRFKVRIDRYGSPVDISQWMKARLISIND